MLYFQIKNVDNSKCMDAYHWPYISTIPCDNLEANQFFAFAKNGQIFTFGQSECVGLNDNSTIIQLQPCESYADTQLWSFDEKVRKILYSLNLLIYAICTHFLVSFRQE